MKISWWLWRQSHLSVGAMYHHSLLPVAIRNSPSHTTSPPTYAFPSIFAIPNRFCSFTSVILMTNVSPAITGFRNLTLSIPAKKKFSREPPTSGCNITRPPTWAIACDQQQIHNRWTRDIDNLVYEPWPRNVTILVIKLAQLGTLIYKIVDLVIKFQKTFVFFFFFYTVFCPHKEFWEKLSTKSLLLCVDTAIGERQAQSGFMVPTCAIISGRRGAETFLTKVIPMGCNMQHYVEAQTTNGLIYFRTSWWLFVKSSCIQKI